MSSHPITLHDLADLPRPGQAGALDVERFLADQRVASLGWPEPVVRQFLQEVGGKDEVLAVYGSLELDAVTWGLERLLAHDLRFYEADPHPEWVVQVAEDHARVLSQRSADERAAWEERGTWLTPPVLIDRELLDPPGEGLQIVEGRTRLGLLRGRMKDRRIVARRLEVWVGRPAG
jgi:hypothetical protein